MSSDICQEKGEKRSEITLSRKDNPTATFFNLKKFGRTRTKSLTSSVRTEEPPRDFRAVLLPIAISFSLEKRGEKLTKQELP